MSPVPVSPPVYVSATVMKSPETLSQRSSSVPSPSTIGSVRPKMPEQEPRDREEEQPEDTAMPMPRRDGELHGALGALRFSGAEVLPGDRRGGAHQADLVQVMNEKSSE